ncbi:MAG: NTP transferase domain-containing protein [Desulfovibrionaceae bacterium]
MNSTAPRTVALIQARLGSSRLPLKTLLCLRGLPLIDWIVQRVSTATRVEQVVVAIPDTPLDDVLAEHLQQQGIAVFRGSENDVLHRFCAAGRAFRAEQIVRICADNPLVSGEAIDQLLEFYAQADVDYAYNHIPHKNLWPDGLGAETLSMALLEELEHKASLPQHREHCLSYIWDNPTIYRIATFDPANPALRRPELKLDMDTKEDFRHLALLPIRPDMSMAEIINLFPAAL